MQNLNQEISFEVAEKNETVTVAIPTPAVAAIAEPLPPLTEQQRKDLETVHPNLKAQIERSMRRKNQQPKTLTTKAPPTFAYKLQPHEEAFLKKAKSQKEREEIWIAIRADQRAKQQKEQAQQLQQAIQTNRKPKPFPTRANKKKQRPAPLTILQTIRYKAGAKYDLLAAERIVSHICRRQGNQKNQQRKGCFESIPNMAKACRIRINRFRKLLAWLTKAGILIAEYREHRSTKYTVAPGRQMIMPMIIDDLKLTPTQNAVARIILRYGIISIRQTAELANASARTAARTAKLLEEKQIVTVRRIQGFTNEYKFCHKVLKFLKRTVAKRPGGLLPKRHPLRNFRGRLSQLRTERAKRQAQQRDLEQREAWKKANPREAAILEEIKAIGRATGNYAKAFLDNCHRLKTA